MLSPYIFRGNVASSQVACSLLRRSTPRRIVPTTATGSVQLRWNTNGNNIILACCRPSTVSAARIVFANQDAVTKMMLSSSSDSLPQQSDSVAAPGVVEQTLREKLTKALDPLTRLTILNESHRHNVYVL
jgi:hypothetical protein